MILEMSFIIEYEFIRIIVHELIVRKTCSLNRILYNSNDKSLMVTD